MEQRPTNPREGAPDPEHTPSESWWQKELKRYNPMELGHKKGEQDGQKETPRKKIVFTTPEDFQVPLDEQEDRPIGQAGEMIEENNVFGDIIREIQARREFTGPSTEAGDVEFKDKMKADLKKAKYKIQGEDQARVEKFRKEKKDAHGYEYDPVRQNIYWRKARESYQGSPVKQTLLGLFKDYHGVWDHLRDWAKEANVWDNEDEQEFLQETGRRADGALERTLRKGGRGLVGGMLMGGMYGVKYSVIAPWKTFEFAIRGLLKVMGDHTFTPQMLDRMFGKKREKEEKTGKGEKKDEKQTKAQEYEVRGKVKNAEIDYLKNLRKNITEQKLRESYTHEEYEALTDETREQLENDALKQLGNTKEVNDYKKAWTNMRRYWIGEEIWNSKNEKQFREDVINFDPKDDDHVLTYMLTPKEFTDLMALERELTRQEQNIDDAKFAQQKKNWEHVVDEIQKIKKELEGEKDSTKQEEKQKELEKLNREERSKRRLVTLRENAHKRIDAIREQATKRANDNALWPPFTKYTRENIEQEVLVTQQEEES